jgi:hypothetical protein
MRETGAREHQRRIRRTAGEMRIGGELAAAADDVDDGAAAARRHALDHRVDDMDVAEVLGLHPGAPGGGREIRGVGAPRGARAVDEHVERPEVLFHALDHGAGGGRVGQVGGRAMAIQRFPCRVEICLRARYDGDAGTFAVEGAGAGEPDAPAAAGDEHILACQAKVHVGHNAA